MGSANSLAKPACSMLHACPVKFALAMISLGLYAYERSEFTILTGHCWLGKRDIV
jgi:hypothetical protein